MNKHTLAMRSLGVVPAAVFLLAARQMGVTLLLLADVNKTRAASTAMRSDCRSNGVAGQRFAGQGKKRSINDHAQRLQLRPGEEERGWTQAC